MNFENTWAAIFKPGEAPDHYFDRLASCPFPEPLAAYSPVNAWWLAELSRLIYRQDRDEIGDRATGRTRNQILHDVGLRESAFVNAGGSQAAIVEPLTPGPSPFAVVVFRGTDTLLDWLDFNFDAVPTPWLPGGFVHDGFKEAFDAVWADIELAIPQGVPIVATGHSLGGALATLAASRRPPACTYTFGSPRVGDAAFGAAARSAPFFRVVNHRDVVTEVPRLLAHVGDLYYVAHDGGVVVDPDAATVFADRLRQDASFEPPRDLASVVTGPPQGLADHAPVNYVAHLERAVSPA